MWNRKDLLGMKDLSKKEIEFILDTTILMKNRIDHEEERIDELKNKTVVTIFYEDSTRTKTSFSLAGKYLGATVQDLGVGSSSVSKGEGLIDTGITLDQMGVHVMIMRNSFTGAPHLLAKNVSAHVINAGDGSNEHPTQSLLDLYTMRQYKGKIEGLKVAIIGDIANSRVARSNVFALNTLGAKVILAGPATLLGKVRLLGADYTTNIQEAVADADVVMGLRIQFERQKTVTFPGLSEYCEFFGIHDEIRGCMKKDVLIMHPGPVNRGIEFSTSVVDGEGSVVHEQVKNGLAVRMAVLKILLEGGGTK